MVVQWLINDESLIEEFYVIAGVERWAGQRSEEGYVCDKISKGKCSLLLLGLIEEFIELYHHLSEYFQPSMFDIIGSVKSGNWGVKDCQNNCYQNYKSQPCLRKLI